MGGFIHPTRWDRIIRNLERSEATYKFCVFFGVKPTQAQHTEAENKNIHIIHYHRQMDIYEEDKISLTNWTIRQLNTYMGVITITANSIVSNRLFSRIRSIIDRFLGLCKFKAGVKGKICYSVAEFSYKENEGRLDIRLSSDDAKVCFESYGKRLEKLNIQHRILRRCKRNN